MGAPDFVPANHRDPLLTQLHHGDPRALEVLYRQYAAPLTRLATRFMGARELGADVVHDVFVSLWERRTQIDIKTTFQAYLYAAVRRHALDLLRHHRVVLAYERHATKDTPLSEGATTPPVDEQYAREELTAALRDAIDALPPKAREVAHLRWDDQLSRAEVAEVMGIAISTVDNHLAAAIRALKTTLSKHY